jgi:hypothetical protein
MYSWNRGPEQPRSGSRLRGESQIRRNSRTRPSPAPSSGDVNGASGRLDQNRPYFP